MRYFWILFLLPFIGFSQEDSGTLTDDVQGDLKYRDDQFYFGVTYNLLMNTPPGINSRGLTGGVHGGFLRDMPINKKRDLAIAVGFGLAYDQFGQNLFIGEDSNGESIFRILDGSVNYDQNRLGMAMVEMPFEFRWRTSTPTDYKFWRIYAGARIGYAYWYKATFRQPGNGVNQTKIPEFNPVRLSATLSFGYSTFNFFVSYSLNPFFKDAYLVEGENIDLRALKVGLIFYIL
ncbi:PorT family protein [Aequorivita sp. H23M31]|uniref:PorT family protein n=1 Tax=Aequorivita ciconiae TaxID=2494375 RepID=A0A410G5H7_9FLAO|nr:porin family protein [Aequorivita sp. H23M31]QAA82513.1 PorT family protein [Aequorivita sp. H23M31]